MNIKKNGKYVPYLGSFLILLGAIKQILYYSFFNFPITEYISISELVTLFFNDILGILFVFFILIVLYVFFSKSNRFERFKRFVLEDDFKTKFDKLNPVKSIFSLIFLSVLFVIYCYLFFTSINEGIITLLISYVITGIAFQIFHVLWKNYGVNMFENDMLILMFAFLSLLFTIRSAYFDYKMVRYKGRYLGTSIRTMEKVVTSNTNCLFIGKTQRYVYFYNVKDSSVLVIPIEEVKEIDVKRKDFGFVEVFREA